MTLRYHFRKGGLQPDYVCQREGIAHAESLCQRIPGAGIDRLIGDLLVEAISPLTLDVALTVQHELLSRLEEADRDLNIIDRLTTPRDDCPRSDRTSGHQIHEPGDHRHDADQHQHDHPDEGEH